MSRVANGTGQPTKNVFKYVVLVIFGYSVAVTGYLFAAEYLEIEPKLSSIVDACKFVSFLSLLYIGGELAYHREQLASVELFRGLGFLTLFAKLIIPISAVIMGLIGLKIAIGAFKLFGDYHSFPPTGLVFYRTLEVYLPYAATFPIFAYSLLNAVAAFYPVKNAGELSVARKRELYTNKKRCVQFFVFSNLTVLVPLVGVLTLLFVSGNDGLSAERDTFLSGAVAVIILVSSIAAKAVEEYTATSS